MLNLEFEQEVIRRYLSEFQVKFNGIISRVEGSIELNRVDIDALVRIYRNCAFDTKFVRSLFSVAAAKR